MRGGGGVEEIRLGPLSRDEVTEQIAGLVDDAATQRLADELFARAEGNPFFTEQLVAAAETSPQGAWLRPPGRAAGPACGASGGAGTPVRW